MIGMHVHYRRNARPRSLGISVHLRSESVSTFRRNLHILLANGIEPAPERMKKTSWETFLKSHWGVIAATDFFTVEVLTPRGLARYLVLFVIDLKTRTVAIAGIAREPNGAWMEQVARNLTDPDVGFLRHARYVIHDRDPLFTGGFRANLKSAGVETVKLPVRSPNLNAYCERLLGSVRRECLDHHLIVTERQMLSVLTEYRAYHNRARPHQGIGQRIPEPREDPLTSGDRVVEIPVLGGLHHDYRLAA